MQKRDLTSLVLDRPPPLDPAWLAHEHAANLHGPKPALTVVQRQPIYAAECRALNAAMMAPGARDHHLSQGITVSDLRIKNDLDGFDIPVLKYEAAQSRAPNESGQPNNQNLIEDNDKTPHQEIVLLYYHGGGLMVGEADSEELCNRRLVKCTPASRKVTLYSPSYRLMPQVSAHTAVSDALSTFTAVRALHRDAKLVLLGSSSGGQLAALVSQAAPAGSVDGVLLRCPVTADATPGTEGVPARFQSMHTSDAEAFATTLLARFKWPVARDGLERMPLEADVEALREKGLPRTWLQVCTNDVLYSDGLCYAQLLQDAGVEVELDIVEGWPHTFWLKAPHLERALEVEEEMIRALDWVLDG